MHMKYIRWSWILPGGLLTEVMILVLVLPLALLSGRESPLYVVPPASFVAAFTLGLWAAGKVTQRRVLHGALVGTVAMRVYVVMGFPIMDRLDVDSRAFPDIIVFARREE
jgi:hypothetical protein